MQDFDPFLLQNATGADLFSDYIDTIVFHDDEDETIILRKVDGEIYVETYVKRLDQLFDQNARDAAEFNRTGRLPELQVRTANIPAALWKAWEREGITKDEKYLRRRLNDSDYRKLRVNDLRL